MPSVRIEEEAFGDERYDDLASAAGLADADHARGKMARLWRQCTLENTHVLHRVTVERILGPRAVEALTFSRLGELVEPGRVRIRGTRGRIEWLEKVRAGGKKGGRPRGLGKQTSGQPQGSAQGKAPPEQEKEQEILEVLGDLAPPELPEQGRRDLVQPPPDRGAVLAASARVPPAPPLHDRAAGDVASDRRRVPVVPAPDVARNQALVRRFVDGINAARARIALALGLRDVRPISHMHGSEATLLDRVRGVASAEADIDHVIAVKEEEAVDTGDMRWLGWTVCEPGAWRVALAAVPGSRKKAKPIGAPPSSPAKFDPLPPRVEMSEEERAEMSKLALAIAADPNKAARGAKP